MSLQRPKQTKFKMWKSLMNKKRKYNEVLQCDPESYATLAAMQGGCAATLPPSLDALRACKYFLLLAYRWQQYLFFFYKYTYSLICIVNF